MVKFSAKSIYSILIIISILLTLAGCSNQQKGPIACTEEAKLCPDGSAVGRTGPNCEFAPCPDVVPEKIPEIFDVKINSLACDWTVKTGDYNVKSDCVSIVSKGIAQGPVGARLELPILSWSTDKFDCGSWTLKPGALIAVGSTCIRKEGQPETTTWSVDAEGCPLKNYFDNERSHSAKIYKDDELEPKKEDRKNIVCQ